MVDMVKNILKIFSQLGQESRIKKEPTSIKIFMDALRKAQVFYDSELAGYITETQEGYIFQYDHKFLEKNIPISSSKVWRGTPFSSRVPSGYAL